MMRRATLALGLLAVTGCAMPATPSRVGESIPREAPSGPRAVILLPFDASSLAPKDQWVGEGVAELVSLGLAQHPTIVQIPRARVTGASTPDVWTEEVMRRRAREVHADAVLYGRVHWSSAEWVLEPRLLDLGTSRAASPRTLRAVDADLIPQISALALLYARALQPTSADESVRIEKAARPTASLRAFELFTRGQTAFHRGDAEAAVDPLVHAIESDPQQLPIAQYALGVVHLALGNRWKAAAQWRAAAQLDPLMPEPFKMFGDLFLAAPRSLGLQATEAYNRAIQLRPFYADAYVGLGDASVATGDADGALNAYQRAVGFDPFNADTHVKLGRIWSARGLCDEAAREHERARDLDPRSPDVRCAR